MPSRRSSPVSLVLALVGAGALVALAGCERADDPARAQRHAVAPRPPQTPTLPPPEAFPPPPPAPDVQDEARTNQALVVAADAAERARAGVDDCETAHNQLVAMLTTVEQELGEQVHRPEKEPFVEVCREMPAPARRCIMPTYAMANQDACTAALEALPDDVRQRFQSVVNGPGAD